MQLKEDLDGKQIALYLQIGQGLLLLLGGAKTPLHVSHFVDCGIPQEVGVPKHVGNWSQLVYPSSYIATAYCFGKVRLKEHTFFWKQSLHTELLT